MKTLDAVQAFLYNRRSINLRPKTLKWYEANLAHFVAFSEELPLEVEPIEQFLVEVVADGKEETRHGYYCTLKAFYRFICKRHSLPNPIELVDAPIRHKKVRPTLSTNELSELCIQPKTLRDTALITLLIDNGVRSGEAVSLKRQNIFDDHIKVDGKTGEREVPISQETRDLLLALVEANRPDSDYVFQGKRGPITVSGVYQIIHPYMLAAGINGPKLGPHRIRHAFGKHYIKNGGDTRSLQKIMGHANITTTEIYVDLSTDDIVEKHRQFTPLRTAHYSTRALREAEDIIRLRRQNE